MMHRRQSRSWAASRHLSNSYCLARFHGLKPVPKNCFSALTGNTKNREKKPYFRRVFFFLFVFFIALRHVEALPVTADAACAQHMFGYLFAWANWLFATSRHQPDPQRPCSVSVQQARIYSTLHLYHLAEENSNCHWPLTPEHQFGTPRHTNVECRPSWASRAVLFSLIGHLILSDTSRFYYNADQIYLKQ